MNHHDQNPSSSSPLLTPLPPVTGSSLVLTDESEQMLESRAQPANFRERIMSWTLPLPLTSFSLNHAYAIRGEARSWMNSGIESSGRRGKAGYEKGGGVRGIQPRPLRALHICIHINVPVPFDPRPRPRPRFTTRTRTTPPQHGRAYTYLDCVRTHLEEDAPNFDPRTSRAWVAPWGVRWRRWR